jgi:hypothetical protein
VDLGYSGPRRIPALPLLRAIASEGWVLQGLVPSAPDCDGWEVVLPLWLP